MEIYYNECFQRGSIVMQKWIHDRLYNRPDSTSLRHSLIHILVIFNLILFQLLYCAIWDFEIPEMLLRCFKNYLSEKTYYSLMHDFLMTGTNGTFLPLVILVVLYYFAIIILWIFKFTKVRISFFIIITLLTLLNFNQALSFPSFTQEEIKQERCIEQWKRFYYDVLFEEQQKDVSQNWETVFILHEDPPNTHACDVRHRIWSNGLVETFYPWKD